VEIQVPHTREISKLIILNDQLWKRGSIDGSGTMLQTERSRVRFSMSLDF
jgi:hypothetical protein